MSHFSVLVVGKDVEKQLAPYHEFECTGEDNEYVQEVDKTAEAREEYESDKTTATRYRDPQGNLHDPYDDEGNYDPVYWREPTASEQYTIETERSKFVCGYGEKDGIRWHSADWKDGEGYRPRVFALPEGWVEVKVPKHEVESFLQFCKGWWGMEAVPFGKKPDLAKKHKYGYVLVGKKGEATKVIDRTNLDKKWDWYSVGGRWNGFFKLRKLAAGVLGKPGIQDMDEGYKPPTADRADVVKKGDIDVEGMRDEAEERAIKRYDLFVRLTDGCPTHKPWEEIQKENLKPGEDGKPVTDWDAARKAYGEQPAVKALRSSKDKDAIWFEPDEFLCTREKYIDDVRKGALSTFAVVKNGRWYERGKMGWWGVVSDEKDEGEWLTQFSALIDSLPDDTLLTIVDCHI